MKKELPKLYANKIDKVLTNNATISCGSEEIINVGKDINVAEKIINIFNSPNYVYKAEVKIKLKSGVVKKQIIGKNKTHLITLDNELIPIEDILDLSFEN